ncbi:MAG: hypothetical protein Q7S55_01485 [Nanoarchaeota archaeon]|nr:hypothetical protein [Nanoarchaeota archaeon]
MLDLKYSHYEKLAGLSEVLRREQVNPHTLKVGREYVQFLLKEPARRGDFCEIAIGEFKGDKEDNTSFLVFSNAVSYRPGYMQLGSNGESEEYPNQPVLLLSHNGRNDDIFLKPEYNHYKAEQSSGFVPLESEDVYKILDESGLGEYIPAARRERIPSGMVFTPAGDIQKIIPDVNKVHAFLVSLENTLRRI